MDNHQLINQNSNSVEWYTPPEIIEAARRAMGSITFDPFSCEKANETVRALKYLTKEQDGFKSDWFDNVWVNHPFSRENNKLIAKKAINEYLSGNANQICMITFAATSESWFQPLLKYPQCFIHGRTHYLDEQGNKVKGCTKGSAVTYLGLHVDEFYNAFKHLGTIKVPYKC